MALKMNIRVRDFIGNYPLMIVALGEIGDSYCILHVISHSPSLKPSIMVRGWSRPLRLAIIERFYYF